MKISKFLTRRCIAVLVLLALPAVVRAQFTFTTNNGSITIIGYTGSDGAVAIPNTINGYPVTSIGGYAFADYNSMTSVTIPSSVTSIGEGVFLGCASLTNISVDAGNPSYSSYTNVLFDKAGDTLIEYPEGLANSTYAIPSTVTSIGQDAFFGSDNLTNIVIPEGVTSIGPEAFAFCDGLTEVSIAASVTDIGGLAFAYCTSLTSAYFASSNAPPDVGNAFYGDPAAVVYYPLGATGWGATFGGAPTEEGGTTPASEFEYQLNDGSITITGYTGPGGAVVIPGTIDRYPVTSIGVEAFGYNSSVTNVIIPNSVTNIGVLAFTFCESLASVTIPDSVTCIGGQAFNACFSLTDIFIPGSVTFIGVQPIGDCSSLTNIAVDATNLFYSSLNGVLFDKAQDTLIQYPTGLTDPTYNVPNTVDTIAKSSFWGCTTLTTVNVPASVTSVGEGAFGACPNLTSAYFQGNAPPDPGDAFGGDPTIVFYMPVTTGWGATFGSAPTELWNPQATAFTAASGQFGFSITGPANGTVVVEACTNLANPAWIPVSTNTLLGSGTSSFSDPQWTNNPNCYYRFSAP